MYKFYHKTFNILLIIALLLSNIVYSEKANKESSALTTENTVNDNILLVY